MKVGAKCKRGKSEIARKDIKKEEKKGVESRKKQNNNDTVM